MANRMIEVTEKDNVTSNNRILKILSNPIIVRKSPAMVGVGTFDIHLE